MKRLAFVADFLLGDTAHRAAAGPTPSSVQESMARSLERTPLVVLLWPPGYLKSELSMILEIMLDAGRSQP